MENVNRFSTWNVRGLYRFGPLMTAVRKLARYKLGLVGVQEVMCEKEILQSRGLSSFLWTREKSCIKFL